MQAGTTGFAVVLRPAKIVNGRRSRPASTKVVCRQSAYRNHVAGLANRASLLPSAFSLTALLFGDAGGGAPSKSRHSANFFRRARLARNPNCRMRTNPTGRICSRKRRMN